MPCRSRPTPAASLQTCTLPPLLPVPSEASSSASNCADVIGLSNLQPSVLFSTRSFFPQMFQTSQANSQAFQIVASLNCHTEAHSMGYSAMDTAASSSCLRSCSRRPEFVWPCSPALPLGLLRSHQTPSLKAAAVGRAGLGCCCKIATQPRRHTEGGTGRWLCRPESPLSVSWG